MRTTSDADAEHSILTTPEGLALLAEVGDVANPGTSDLARWRKLATTELVSAALRIATTRRRGAAKFARAGAMWFEPTALEQATAEPVARHKARRFAGEVAFDLCAGIGGDTLALASEARLVVAVDLDHGMARRALWNAGIYGVADRVAALRGHAETTPIPPSGLVHIDPDRRSAKGPRAKAIEGYAPNLAFLQGLARRGRGGAIKLGPASDFGAHFGGQGFEIELISLKGECKEATAWFDRLVSCGRRATCLPAGASWTDRDGPSGPAPPSEISSYVFDPDPSLIRAGLLDGFALAHGMSRAAGVDLLTGPDRVESPFLAAFKVEEVLPLDLKRLRRIVADRRLGPLEIKTKGLRILPEAVRAELRPEGPNPATLFLIRGRGPSRAIWARRPG